MTIDPMQVFLALGVASALAVLRVPLAAAVFFAGVFLLGLTAEPLPQGFMLDFSLALRLNSPALIAMPMFALAGELAVTAGISERLLNLAGVLSGRGPRAAGNRVVLGCTLFAAVSGVGVTAVRSEGGRLTGELLEAGFRREIVAGLVATAAGLSIIIPASVPLSVFAAAAGVDTNVVFTATFLPGLLTAASLAIAIAIYSRLRHVWPNPPEIPFRSRLSVIREAKWSILMPILTLSGLFTGFFTAPEAAAFSVVYVVLTGVLLHKEMDWRDIPPAMGRASLTASIILLLVGVGGLFLMLMDVCGFNRWLADVLYAMSGGRIGAILLMNLLLLAAGCLLDAPASISLLVPLLLPLAEKCGLSVLHFGAMAVINLAIGLITPPQAHNIAAAAHLADVSMWRAAMAAWPFILAMLVCLGMVSFIPFLSLWLPTLFGWA